MRGGVLSETDCQLFSVMVESARIARSSVQPLTELTVDGADAVVIPGGFGAAKNLSDFGFKVDSIFIFNIKSMVSD